MEEEQIKPWEEDSIRKHSILLNDSFFYWTGKYLINPVPPPSELAGLLYNAPFILVSHGLESDPIFNYANKAAQNLWKISWEDFIKMPSRLSAEPDALSSRQELFNKANQNGFSSNYSGIRITKDKKKFMMKDAVLWKVIDEQGKDQGHAAVFWDWQFL